jgi:hypothetical protein
MNLKFAKNANMTLNIFKKKISMGYQKTQNFMLIHSLKWAKKSSEKAVGEFWVFRILHFLQCFIAYKFPEHYFRFI